MLAKTTMGLVSGLALMLAAWPALAEGPLDEITIAYYTEWPIPVMAYKDNPKLEEELGVKVNWVSFETGTAMSAAMASGDVQIALSQGVPPFVVAVSSGQDLQLIDIAVNYSDTDNCVVRSDLEIDKTNAGELAGKKVAVPWEQRRITAFCARWSISGCRWKVCRSSIWTRPPAQRRWRKGPSILPAAMAAALPG